jgi:hypothetical protein
MTTTLISDGINNIGIIGDILPSKEEVMEDTWGHLRAKQGTMYTGYVIFTLTAFGDYVTIDYDFKDLDSSPWLYDNVYDFVVRKAKDKGKIYKFTGTYHELKNLRGIFQGKLHIVKIT